MRKTFLIVMCVLGVCIGVTGCGSSKSQASIKSKETKAVKETQKKDEGIILDNKTGKTLIQTVSENSAYPNTTYMITSSNGEFIVLDPTGMPKKEEIDLNPVAITSTHSHPDHIDYAYTKSYSSVPQMLFKSGTLETKDFKITNIASSHLGDDINEESPSNVITIVDVDGLRIVHMGDCGQSSLTDDQLKAIGKVDVMITQFANPYSDMTFDSNMGKNLVDQVNPAIVIPTHYGAGDLDRLSKTYGQIKEFNTTLKLDKKDITSDKTQLYRIINNKVESQKAK